MAPDDAGSILVLRVWGQAGIPVARVLSRAAGQTSVADVGALAGEDAIVDAVREWLRRSVAPGAGGDGDGRPGGARRDGSATEM